MNPDDLAFLTALHQDPEVMKYIGMSRSQEMVAARLEKIIAKYSERAGFGIWMACLIDSDGAIGWACLKDLDGSTYDEIGYRLATNYWGKGYATELAIALVSYAFTSLNLAEISGVSNPDNLGSIAVLRKAGLIFRRKAQYYDSIVDYFSITKEGWLRKSVDSGDSLLSKS